MGGNEMRYAIFKRCAVAILLLLAVFSLGCIGTGPTWKSKEMGSGCHSDGEINACVGSAKLVKNNSTAWQGP